MTPFYTAYISVPASVQTVFWLATGALLYAYVGYPLLLAIVALFCKQSRREPGYCPPLSVIIPAYNEETNIGQKLAATLALEYPPEKLEILVVSDGSTDRTDSIVKACKDARVRLIQIEDRRGKTHAQNEAVKHCLGEVVVFSDATTVYHRDALLYLACNYEDPQVGAVSGCYRYVDSCKRSQSGLGSVVFWSYENMIKRLQSKISSLTGCSGCIYSVRKSAYTPLPNSACSDLAEPLHVVKHGYRVVFEERALAYEEATRSAKDEFRMRVRVAAHGISGVLALPELLKFWRFGWVSFQLISHKLLRWLAPCFLILLLISCALLIDQTAFRWLFFLQVCFYLFGLASLLIPLHRRWQPLGLPLYFCTLNLATLVSFIKVFRGQRYVIWDTVRK